jgi:hypothetical protein
MWCKHTAQRCQTIRRFPSATKSRNFAAAFSIVGCIQRQSTYGRDSFQILQDAIQIADNYRDCRAIAATNGYGVAAAALQSQYHYHLRTILFFSNNLRQWRRGLMLGKQRQTPCPTQKDSQEQYCYTHGLCAHSSKECRTPDNVQATARNTTGAAAAKRRAKEN